MVASDAGWIVPGRSHALRRLTGTGDYTCLLSETIDVDEAQVLVLVNGVLESCESVPCFLEEKKHCAVFAFRTPWVLALAPRWC